MFTLRRNAVLAVAAALALGLGVYAVVQLRGNDEPTAADSRVVQPGAPGQSARTLSPQEIQGLAAPKHTLADTIFIQGMIPHHAQALQMTALVNERTGNKDLQQLAERITVSQKDEIAQMQRWLTDRGEKLPEAHTSHASHDQLMPGMLSDAQLAQLAAARGSSFDRLFLEFMIGHHQGALIMVERLYSNGGGLEPASDRFGREINADQNIEIKRMRDMLSATA